MATITRKYIDDLAGYLTDAQVLDRGDRDSRAWLDGLRAVHRHLFVPRRGWAEPMDDRPEHLIDRRCDPLTWWDAVYSNYAIITQRGDGKADIADTTSPPSSSLSCPHVSMEMLRLLVVANGHPVLEIGTGTGWTAAMLGWRLGDDQVVTVELDEHVATQARRNLSAAGRTVQVVTGDGSLGHDARAPYDRVHVTCGVGDIPYAWVQQTRPGGLIVAPWTPAHGQWGELLRLRVRYGGTAIGRFCGPATFMMMRSQRRPRRWPPYDGEAVTSAPMVDPRVIPVGNPGFGLFLASVAPRLAITWTGLEVLGRRKVWTMRLRDLEGTGWAVACAQPGQGAEIEQGGRRLWDDLEGVYVAWVDAGRPGRDRFGMTVGPGGQRIWLDSPDSS